ncbi:MAG: YciI family protein [Chloroflexi bacterium]|nr:YciI family protein [Chloroflexota bacterium]
MMYMFLICYDPAIPLGPNDPPTLQPQHAALGEALRGEGRYVSGGALMPYEGAPVVRVQGQRSLGVDGPYAETKEVLGGYYVVDCADAADAEAVARRIPVASNAWIQVRQLLLHNKG